MPRQRTFGSAQSPNYLPASAGKSRSFGYGAVGRDLAFGNAPDHHPNLFKQFVLTSLPHKIVVQINERCEETQEFGLVLTRSPDSRVEIPGAEKICGRNCCPAHRTVFVCAQCPQDSVLPV